MTPRTKYLGFWYEASATSSPPPDSSKWQGEVKLGTNEAAGTEEVILDGYLVPGFFSSEEEARDAAIAYVRDYIDRL
jgi:hypothetical protein